MTPGRFDHADPVEERPLPLDITLYPAPQATANAFPRLRIDLPHPSSPILPNTNEDTSAETAAADLLASILGAAPSSAETKAPASQARPPISVTIDVHPNAELVVAEQNVIDMKMADSNGKGGGDVDMEKETESMVEKTKQVERLVKALDVAADIGVWAEWVRREVMRD